MKTIELFAGGGGLALGSASAGYEHEYLVEWDRDSAKTLYHNHELLKFSGDSEWIYNGDIRDLDFKSYFSKIDFVSGGPPCQPFSIGGKHQAYHDQRDMFPQAARVIREVQPKAFMFENVRGLVRKSFQKYFGYIILQLTYPQLLRRESETWQDHLRHLEEHHTGANFKGLQYNVMFRLINAADYGIPQKRERVIIVGFRTDFIEPWSFPAATHSSEALEYSKWGDGSYWARHKIPSTFYQKQKPKQAPSLKPDELPWSTIRDAIGDLPTPRKVESSIPNHRYQPGARVYTGHTGSPLDEPAKTIKAGSHGVPGGENMLVNDDGSVRYFTVREAARLQTFPDNYIFPCSWTESMRQIGNAVPVKLGALFAESIKETILINERRSSPNGKTKNLQPTG